MKKVFSCILASVFSLCILTMFCSCNENSEEENMSAEDISYVPYGAEVSDILEETVTQYLTAVTEQNHAGILSCTAEDFIWNYNETGFYDYSRNAAEFEITDIDKAHIICGDNRYVMPLSYKLTYSGEHKDENGISQGAGDYEYSKNFIIVYEGDRYLISDITERVMG